MSQYRETTDHEPWSLVWREGGKVFSILIDRGADSPRFQVNYHPRQRRYYGGRQWSRNELAEYLRVSTDYLDALQDVAEAVSEAISSSTAVIGLRREAERILSRKFTKVASDERLAMGMRVASRRKCPDVIPPQLSMLEAQLYEWEAHLFPPVVYFLIASDIVVYVGQSTLPASRIVTHLKDKTFDRVLVLPVAEYDLDDVEQHYIELLQPKYNLEFTESYRKTRPRRGKSKSVSEAMLSTTTNHSCV